MAQYFTSFDDTPALTEQWHTGDGSYTIETTGLPTGTNDGAALKIVMSSAARYALSWDAVGTPTGDVEFLMRWQVDATGFSSAAAGRAVICGGGDSTSEDGYFAGHTVTGTAASQFLVEYPAGSSLGSASKTLSINTYYWTRVEKTGTTIRFRTWSGAIGDEPGAWDVSNTDSTLSGGWVGPGQHNTSQTLWVDLMGCGTGGDSAPSEAVGATGSPIHHYQRMRVR